MKYLLLDTQNRLKEVGSKTARQLRDELGLNQKQFIHFLNSSKLYHNRYIIVEDFKESNAEKENDVFTQKLLFERNGKRYYVSRDAKFFVIYKNGNQRELTCYPRIKRNVEHLFIKLAVKDYRVKSLVAQAFVEGWYQGCNAIPIDGNNLNCKADNLKIMSKTAYAKISGRMTKCNKPLGLYENNKLVKEFRSTREAEGQLYISRQTVSDLCNCKVKKRLYDLRWL